MIDQLIEFLPDQVEACDVIFGILLSRKRMHFRKQLARVLLHAEDAERGDEVVIDEFELIDDVLQVPLVDVVVQLTLVVQRAAIVAAQGVEDDRVHRKRIASIGIGQVVERDPAERIDALERLPDDGLGRA